MLHPATGGTILLAVSLSVTQDAIIELLCYSSFGAHHIRSDMLRNLQE